jgi:arsenate reductase
MKEVGIDISGHRSKVVDEFAGQAFDVVLTVCDSAKETCPIYPGHATRIHRAFSDPAAVTGSDAARFDAFRQVRDELRTYLREELQADISAVLRS